MGACMGEGMISVLVGSKRLPGFLRRRYRWIILGTLVWNASAVGLLMTPLGRGFSSVFIIMLLTGAFAGTLAWIMFNATCERVGREATTRLGLRCWQCGYQLDGLADPVCPECGERFEEAELRSRWQRFVDWARRGT